jgi:hypothetical protein
MPLKQGGHRILKGSTYYDSQGQNAVPTNSRIPVLQARGGQGPPHRTRLPGPSNLIIPVPSPSDAAQADPSALNARSESEFANQGPPRHPENVHSGDLASPSRRSSESANSDQESEIAVQVAQLRREVGVVDRWRAGDSLEATAAHFRVRSSAVKQYFEELALADKDDIGPHKDARFEKRCQPSHGR